MDRFLDRSALAHDWAAEGASSTSLVNALTNMYWEGVVRDISHAIRCMQLWKDTEPLQEEEDIMLRLPGGAASFIEPWGK